MQGNDRREMQVTNDGATILKAIGVDNPAAKILVGEFQIAKPENDKTMTENNMVFH